ncbi:GHKL domain-containing protein [Bacillus sp. RG28]|uniref:histidine kinase n=1 Tax=Gottfriedia endophytica TaxID=2820819 RepID=A0A940NJK8_9BACI|nr:histidine kinase N-terminal domain-containing protein [Gottfriedia endophytica]MBP0726504.1 GHKL domain-containing protein [Gottfriedia endophytica]
MFPITLSLEQRYCTFIRDNKPVLIENWVNNVYINSDDPYKDIIIVNGAKLIDHLLLYLEGESNERDIQDLSDKIAEERVHAGVNIGDFVYNANNGRSEIFTHLAAFEEKVAVVQPLINKINFVFDQFIYFTIKKYSEVMAQDIEEKQNFIDETHKERLTILGQMSASFVHEFRNPLTSIIGFVKLLRIENPQMKYLEIIDHELHQLNFRIEQFLHISKKENDKVLEYFMINDLFKDITDFLYPSLVNSSVILQEVFSDKIYVHGFRNEIRQVLLNIFMNSIDALISNKDKKIVQYQVVEVEDKIIIKIRNNGPKIDDEKICTIFEPFVTTKSHGTGIGLFVCKQIIEKHEGQIECYSDEQWTSFFISLPKINA